MAGLFGFTPIDTYATSLFTVLRNDDSLPRDFHGDEAVEQSNQRKHGIIIFNMDLN